MAQLVLLAGDAAGLLHFIVNNNCITDPTFEAVVTRCKRCLSELELLISQMQTTVSLARANL